MSLDFNTGAREILPNLSDSMFLLCLQPTVSQLTQSEDQSPSLAPPSLNLISPDFSPWSLNISHSYPPTCQADLRASALTTPFAWNILLLVKHGTFSLADFGAWLRCHGLKGDVLRLPHPELPPSSLLYFSP